MQVAVLDASDPIAMNCGDVVSAEAGKEGAAKRPRLHLITRAARQWRALVLVAVGAFQG